MDNTKSMQELTAAFDQALVAAGYSESRLSNFRTVTKRLLTFGADLGIECYSSYLTVGKEKVRESMTYVTLSRFIVCRSGLRLARI